MGTCHFLNIFPTEELLAVMAEHSLRTTVFLFCYFDLCTIKFNKSLHCSKSSLHYSKTSKSFLETWSLSFTPSFPPFIRKQVHIKMPVLCILCTKTNVLTNIKKQLTPMKFAVETSCRWDGMQGAPLNPNTAVMLPCYLQPHAIGSVPLIFNSRQTFCRSWTEFLFISALSE